MNKVQKMRTKQQSPWPKQKIQSHFAAIIHTSNFPVTHQKLDAVSDWETEIISSSGLQFIHRSGRVQEMTQLYLHLFTSELQAQIWETTPSEEE